MEETRVPGTHDDTGGDSPSEPATGSVSDAAADATTASVGPEEDRRDGAPPGAERDAKEARGRGPEAASVGEAGPEPPKKKERSQERPAGERGPRRRPRDPAVARAYRTAKPVEGRVEKVIKGGYEVRVAKTRGFCPHSQMDLARVEDPSAHVGKSYLFRITQMRRGGEDIILSRRAVLEEERSDEAKAVRATLIEGAVMQGRVARLADFGAFVDLGAGVTGLVHISELGASRVSRVGDACHVGERVTVKILKLDESTGRISLSMRQARDDPWHDVSQKFQPGAIRDGKIVRVADFGAFVEMEPGVEALAPAREFPPSAEGWPRGLEPGTTRPWVVLSVDPERRRMSVSPAGGDGIAAPQQSIEPGAHLKGRVQQVQKFGVFVWLAPGRVGLVPSVWTGTPRGTDLETHFPVGTDVDVEVVEIAEGGKRIRLTMDAAATARSTAEPAQKAPPARRERRRGREESRETATESRKPEAETSAGPTPAFGTSLGDALKSALEKRNSGG